MSLFRIMLHQATFEHELSVVAIMNAGISERTNAYLHPFDKTEGARWFRSLMENSIQLCVFEHDGEVHGWGSLTPYRSGRGALDKCLEITFYVHPHHRKKGVASAIIDHSHEFASEHEYKHLIAILLDDNHASRSLLEKHGYFIWGLFPEIVHHEDKDRGHLYMGINL